ncbi:MAG: hypothetical protein ABI760_17995, partial [Ferruginibacter sp.]
QKYLFEQHRYVGHIGGRVKVLQKYLFEQHRYIGHIEERANNLYPLGFKFMRQSRKFSIFILTS